MTTKKPRRRNVRKLFARMHPKSMTFQPGTGSGGLPVETPLDIAAAAGMAGRGGDPQRLAVTILCLRWWPGMFYGPSVVVGHRTITREIVLRPKQPGKSRAAVKEKREERIPIEKPTETAALVRVANLIGQCLYSRIHRDLANHDANLNAQIRAAMHRERAPNLRRVHGTPLPDELAGRIADPHAGLVARWARVVIDEYCNPNHCQACQMWGRVGEVPKPTVVDGKITDIKWEPCEACVGLGTVHWSAHRRARALGIGNHPFRDFLAEHHNGALSLLQTMEDRGARLMLRRLGQIDD